MGERFTDHANHIHIFTPITRIVATKFLLFPTFWMVLPGDFPGDFFLRIFPLSLGVDDEDTSLTVRWPAS